MNRAVECTPIEKGGQRVWKKHRAWIITLPCACAGLSYRPCFGQIMPAHCRNAAIAGTGLKSHDWYLLPLCHGHHLEQGQGERSFEARYGLGPPQAIEYARRSPDMAMREAMERQLARSRW